MKLRFVGGISYAGYVTMPSRFCVYAGHLATPSEMWLHRTSYDTVRICGYIGHFTMTSGFCVYARHLTMTSGFCVYAGYPTIPSGHVATPDAGEGCHVSHTHWGNAPLN